MDVDDVIIFQWTEQNRIMVYKLGSLIGVEGDPGVYFPCGFFIASRHRIAIINTPQASERDLAEKSEQLQIDIDRVA